mmetsp:Transcript_28961/g.61191  ORF Transcript_28961/g.61191 Transcript_28961/m.61191 type:complete len:504 (-) Transcript_28961:622-2133(-)
MYGHRFGRPTIIHLILINSIINPQQISNMAESLTPIKPLDVSLVFLGTASMRPSPTRNVSGNALRIGREWTIIDCGEGTQHQILRAATSPGCTRISPGNIHRIFITHLHGDHCFGLPGLLCFIDNAFTSLQSNDKSAPKQKQQKVQHCDAENNNNKNNSGPVLHIVGPFGLRNMIRMALLTSSTNFGFSFRVDELWTEANLREEDGATKSRPRHYASVFDLPSHPSEIVGANVHPESDGTWKVPPHPAGGPADEAWRVHAAPLVHTIESVGYVFAEAPHRGTMDTSTLRDRLLAEENKLYQQSIGVRNPLQLLGSMQKGQSATIKEGGLLVDLDPNDYMSPPTPGRKIVVLGDTCDSRALAGLAANADVIVHEATNAAIEEGETEEGVTKLAVSRGHSTPSMAGSFARSCGAKQLVCTHFSSRYKGDESEQSTAVMERIVGYARDAFGSDNVIASRDLMEVKVLVQKKRGNISCRCTLSPEEALKAAAIAADSYIQMAGHAFD